jgi:hypothetical protein
MKKITDYTDEELVALAQKILAKYNKALSEAKEIAMEYGFEINEKQNNVLNIIYAKLKEQRDAAILAFGIAVDRKQQALHGNLGSGLVDSPGATKLLACDGSAERAILVEGDGGVLSVNAHLLEIRSYLLLNLGSSYLTTSLSQQVLAGEGASWAVVVPSAHHSCLRYLVETDNAGKGIGQRSTTCHCLEDCTCSA